MLKKTALIVYLLFSVGQLRASDVRVAGLGGGGLAVKDIEYDVFWNPGVLATLNDKIGIVGFGARFGTITHNFTCIDTNGTIIYQTEHSYLGRAYNPSIGFIFPIETSGTAIAAMTGGDFGNNTYYKGGYGVINLRLAQKVSNIGLGIGYDRIVDDVYNYQTESQILAGLYTGRSDHNISFIIKKRFYRNTMSDFVVNAIWYQKATEWINMAVMGGLLRTKNGAFDNNNKSEYFLSSGFELKVRKIRTSLYGDFGFYISHSSPETESYYNQQSPYFWMYPVKISLETNVTSFAALRFGTSERIRYITTMPYSTIIYPRLEYSAGTTIDFTKKIKMEYTFSSNFKDIDKNNHYFKLIYKY